VKDRLLLITFMIILLIFGGLVARKFILTHTPEAPVVNDPQSQTPVMQREVLLYFAVPDAPYLEAENREIEDCQAEEECLRNTVQALIDGPVGALVPVLPARTVLRQLTVEGDLIVVDFSKDFVNGHPGGSLTELLTVYSLVDSLAVNFPYVRQMRILVEGVPLDTIKGHVDLRSPVGTDFRYTRKAEPSGDFPHHFIEENSETSPSEEQ
jgi:spore germination protein GerM